MQRTSGPVTTDALFASATKNGTSLTRFAVSEATVFRWMDEEMLSASAPVTMTFNRQNASLAVCEIDSLAKTSSITLKLGGAASSVVLNGTPLPFTSNGTGIVSFTVDRSGSVRIGLKMTTDVGSRFDAQPSRMSLDTVYPNPFNPSTNIRFTLSRLQQAKLEVYDVRGRNLSTIVDRLMQPGTYTCSWNAGSYPSGVYYFRLQTEDEVQHGKAMLIK